MREDASNQKIGTTKRGIGPAYEDKVGRRALRAIDLKLRLAKIEDRLRHEIAIRKFFDETLQLADGVLGLDMYGLRPKLAKVDYITYAEYVQRSGEGI